MDPSRPLWTESKILENRPRNGKFPPTVICLQKSKFLGINKNCPLKQWTELKVILVDLFSDIGDHFFFMGLRCWISPSSMIHPLLTLCVLF